MSKRKLVIFPILLISLFVYGVAVGHYQIFPYDELKELRLLVSQTESSAVTDRPQIYDTEESISERILINSESDVVKKRYELNRYIWMLDQSMSARTINQNISDDGFPLRLPNNVDLNISPSGYENIKNLERIDSFTINMDFGKNEDKPFMILSRLTFATIDAAAIEMHFSSPLIIQ